VRTSKKRTEPASPAITVHPKSAATRSRGWYLPAAFTARFDSDEHPVVEMDVVLEGDPDALNGADPVCVAIRVIRRSGEPAVSTDELRRIAVTRWLALACREAAQTYVGRVSVIMAAESHTDVLSVVDHGETLEPLKGDQRDRAIDEFRRPARRGGWNRVTDDRLRKVGRICEEWQDDRLRRGIGLRQRIGKSLVEVVYEPFCRSQVWELIRRAKEAGYYTPKKTGKD
jgi:hypothetical protein